VFPGEETHDPNTQHGTSKCAYKDEEHIHSHANGCYDHFEHTHNESCYRCNKVEHFHSNTGNDMVLVYTITAKYEANIGSVWPTYDKMQELGAHQNSYGTDFYGWSVSGVSSTYVSKRLEMTAELCGKTATANYQRGTQTAYYYFFEDVDQSNTQAIPPDETGQGRVLYNNVWYVSDPDYYQKLSADNLTAKEVIGMTEQNNGNSVNQTTASGDSCKCFFYKRNASAGMTLSFFNVDRVDQSFDYTDGLKYGMFVKLLPAIMEYVGDENVPDYPANMEQGGFTFDKWYTTPECFPGTEVDWDTLKMPNGSLTVYAKWIPIRHTVRVFKNEEKQVQVGETQIIDHGHHASGSNSFSDDANKDLIFIGWFYRDENGAEQYFKFNSMQVKHDMDIYAKWHSTTLVKFAIYFQLEDGTNVADPIVDERLAGHNQIFEAKPGSALYPEFQEGYFPRVPSHSIIMKQGEDGDEDFVNTYTFVYEKHEKITYQVHYLEEGTDRQLLPSITANGYFIEVTEIFKYVEDYETDTYSITKTLSTQGDNDIIFYYTESQTDPGNAPYRVLAYLQETEDTSRYTEYVKEGVCPKASSAVVGEGISETVFNIEGFVPIRAEIRGTGESLEINGNAIEEVVLPKEGLEIVVYYNRVQVDYVVEHHYQYTVNGEALTEILIEPETRTGLYGQSVSASALDLTGIGYGLVSDPTATINLDSLTQTKKITFIYTENNVTFTYYRVMGREGTVALGSEPAVPAFHGTAQGQAAIDIERYTFVGWFLDERCAFPVVSNDRVTVDEQTGYLTPKKITKTVDGKEYEVYESATYYALYEPNYSKLVIDVVQSEGVSMDQTFLYRVQGKEEHNRDINLTVAIHGTHVATIQEIPVGVYEVVEITNWAWRYQPDAVSKEIYVTVDDTRLNFIYTSAEDRWLTKESFGHHMVPKP